MQIVIALVVVVIVIILFHRARKAQSRRDHKYPVMPEYESGVIVKKLLDAQSALDLADGERNGAHRKESSCGRVTTETASLGTKISEDAETLRETTLHLMAIMEKVTARPILRQEDRNQARDLLTSRDPIANLHTESAQLIFGVDAHIINVRKYREKVDWDCRPMSWVPPVHIN